MTLPARILGLLVVAALSSTAVGRATTIPVSPGPGTPLQDAIDGAAPGDVVSVQGGTYNETVSITKRLKVVGASGANVSIESPCDAPAAVAVGADYVTLKNLTIRGGIIGIDIEDRTHVQVRLVAVVTCDSTTGVRVVRSTRIQVRDVSVEPPFATTSTAPGVHLEDLPVKSGVVLKNIHLRNNAGALVENSQGVKLQSPDTPIELRNSSGNQVSRMETLVGPGPAPIVLRGSDGNKINNNAFLGLTGTAIDLDATSDYNLLLRNAYDDMNPGFIVDAGTGNCRKGNHSFTGAADPFETAGPCPAP